MSTQEYSNEQSEKIQAAGRNLLLYIYSMFKTGEIHDLNNDAWIRPCEKISDVLRELFKYEKRRVTFILYEGTAQVNAHALWLDKSTLETTQELEQFFAVREIGGVIFREVPKDDSLKEFFYQVARYRPTEGGDDQNKALTDLLVKRGVSALTIAPRPNRLDQVGTGVRGVKSIWTYSKSVAAFTEVYQRRPIEVRKARRLIQEIVDACTNEQDLMVGLAMIGGERTRERLAVDTAILCVAIGRGLGLTRKLCSDLAMAGLLSEIGGAYIGEREQNIEVDFATAELTFRQLAEGSSLTESFLNRIAVAVEWSESLRSETYRLAGSPAQLPMSALVRTCRLFLDRIHGLKGPPLTAVAAVEARAELTTPSDKRACAILALTIGFLPVGSVVRMQNGDIGVVSEIEHIRGVRAFSSADLPLSKPKKIFVTRLIDAHNKRLTQRDTRVCLGDAAQTGEWTVQGVLSGLGFEQHILQGLFPNPGLVRKQLGVSG